ncbi:MAG: single-stranded DNA-binding protein [Lentisphaeria bacterium]|nr:single-stranded DNA-binding protein [Lentisphaeria bacterium]
MATLNKVFLLGNLSRDPELRHTSGGTAICDLGLAVSRRFISNGQEQEEVCFVDVIVWGKSGANCAKYLQKGRSVMIEGRLRLDQWEDKNGGGKRQKLKVFAENVQFVGGKREDNSVGGESPRRGVDSQYAPPPMPEMPETDINDIPY